MPKRPPKAWFRKVLKRVKKYENGIKNPSAVVGYIWWKLPTKKRKEILKRYEK